MKQVPNYQGQIRKKEQKRDPKSISKDTLKTRAFQRPQKSQSELLKMKERKFPRKTAILAIKKGLKYGEKVPFTSCHTFPWGVVGQTSKVCK